MQKYHCAHLTQGFQISVKDRPAASALWVNGKTISYHQLATEAYIISDALNGLQNILPTKSVKRCAVLGNRSKTVYASLLGISLSNITFVPLNAHFPIERNLSILVAAKVSAIIIDKVSIQVAKRLLEKITEPIYVLLPDFDVLPGWVNNYPQHRFWSRSEIAYNAVKDCMSGHHDSNEAYVLFTSGSTGSPKGIAITHANVLAYLNNIRQTYEITEKDRCTQLFDLTFDLSIHDMFVCWQSGACLYVPPIEALLFPAQFIKQHRISVWFSVPSIANLMRDYRALQPSAFPDLRISLFCGEALSNIVAREWQHAAPNSIIDNLYGPTETTIAITRYCFQAQSGDQWRTIVPIGEPFSDHSFQVVNEHCEAVAPGEQGELLLAGPQLSPGYIDNPAATQAQFINKQFPNMPHTRWYRTGDIVSYHKEFGLYFHGRVDHQIKVRGYRVEILEVETVLRRVSGYNQVAIVPWPLDTAGSAKSLLAYIVAESINKHAVIEMLCAQLPEYMHIAEIRLLNKMPLNANGKVDYVKLGQALMNTDVILES